MPQERVLVSATRVYTSRWLAIQEYAKTHPRITGGHDKIGQCITPSVLADFRDQVKSVLSRDEDFSAEPSPVQEWNIDQEIIKKFWAEQGLADLKRDIISIPKAEQSRNLTSKAESYDTISVDTCRVRRPSAHDENQQTSTYAPQQRRFSTQDDSRDMPPPQPRKVPQHLKSSLDFDNDQDDHSYTHTRKPSFKDDSATTHMPAASQPRKVPQHLKSSIDFDDYGEQPMPARAPHARKPSYQDDDASLPRSRNQSPSKSQPLSSSPKKRDLYRSWGDDDM